MAYFLADPKDYGNLGVIISMITIMRVFLSTGLPQTTSRFIAMEEQHSSAILWQSLKIQLVCSMIVLLIYTLGTPVWSLILNDTTLTTYILVSSLLIPGTGTLQIFLAYLNGKRQFGQQAFYIGLYSGGRFVFAMAFVLLGMKVMGVLLGFITAVFITLVVLFFKIKIPRPKESYNIRKLINFSMPIVFFSIAVSLLLNFDVLLLKHFYPDSPLIGYYTGAMNLGKMPYFILFAYSVTLLPMVSKALGDNEIQKGKDIISESISSLVFIIFPASAIVMATSESLLAFVYPSDYKLAGMALKILFCSMSGLAILHSLCSITTANGKPYLSMIIAFSCVPVQFGLGIWLVPKFDMTGMALANLISVGTGLIFASLTVFYYFGPFFNVGRTAKAAIGSVIIFYLIRLLPTYPVAFVPVICMAGAMVFILVVMILDRNFRDQMKSKTVSFVKTVSLRKRV